MCISDANYHFFSSHEKQIGWHLTYGKFKHNCWSRWKKRSVMEIKSFKIWWHFGIQDWTCLPPTAPHYTPKYVQISSLEVLFGFQCTDLLLCKAIHTRIIYTHPWWWGANEPVRPGFDWEREPRKFRMECKLGQETRQNRKAAALSTTCRCTAPRQIKTYKTRDDSLVSKIHSSPTIYLCI